MMRNVWRATVATVILAVLTGLVYPLVMTGFAQAVFHGKAEGSIVTVDGKPVASRLIGQKWSGPQWFYGRPSAIDYDASTSSGSNLGPLSADLVKAIADRAAAIMKVEGPYVPGLTVAKIPSDLLLASASGLDPDISPEAAFFQVPRIAKARHLSEDRVRQLIQAQVERRIFGLLGEPRVNVLRLNLALDQVTS